MAATRRVKFTQELANKIINTRGVLATERPEVRRFMTSIAAAPPEEPPVLTRRTILLALQVAARDPEVWNALIAARAALGKT